nr:RNA-directed DNA polymerase, eukaryota [Tanacetum cinerariifolium]
MLWSYLTSLITSWNGESLIMGDFNEVRCIEERWGSVFNVYGANAFNSFISNSGLNDILLEGYSFTWAYPLATKMSKLDRFLMSNGLLSSFPHISAICLDRHLSDHRPILLREVISDFGPTPFHFYHSWLGLPGFDDLVMKSCNSFVLDDSNGVMVYGDWIDDPDFVKQEFRSHFADKFQDPGSRRGSLNFLFPNRVSNDQILDLESLISKDEICTAVWGCGVDKSPRPDGFTFEFFHNLSSGKASILVNGSPTTEFHFH